ncbi:TetR/AcrR family transcriptional regulator [Phaeobacter piscinae]|uniref:TetR/AcrR family transcriptional regulator n=1 Tax=Phaeobacter piscinae TaxID=1580596 RepID=UPI000C9BD0DE|nr:TetR/AcrR family transcriptional regulator [Phaeobacter piscinae]AUQ75735.1 transcriptional regulator, TetR family [Phaeobacter piscinae]
MDTTTGSKPDPDQELSRSQRRRRDDIVEAALKVFERDGYEAAKMIDIAKEAEVAKGTLYLYFENKSVLLEGVIQTAILPALEQIGGAAKAHTGNAQELLEHHIRIIAARQASPEMKMLIRLMISAPEQHAQLIKFFHTHVVQEGLELIRSTLRTGVESGEFRPDVADMDPLVLVGSHVYAPVWHNLFQEEGPLDIERLVEDNLKMVMSGLLVRS